MPDAVLVIGDKIGVGGGAIDAGEHGEHEIAELGDAVKRHRVPVGPDVPMCCIDGRCALHTLDGGQTSPRPSVAGGPVTAYAAAEMVNWFGTPEGTLGERYDRIVSVLNAASIKTGNHVDKRSVDSDFKGNATGCGANDKLSQNVTNVLQNIDAVSGFIAPLMGDNFSASSMAFNVQVNLTAWNPMDGLNSLRQRDASTVEVLQSDESPTHGHREVLVVFNMIEGTTIDRDALFNETGKQVFVVDVWLINKMAHALASGPHADVMERDLQHAMLSYQVGTYLSLCNGSQRPAVLTEAA